MSLAQPIPPIARSLIGLGLVGLVLVLMQLLSMPITVMLLLVFQGDESTRWLARIIGREA